MKAHVGVFATPEGLRGVRARAAATLAAGGSTIALTVGRGRTIRGPPEEAVTVFAVTVLAATELGLPARLGGRIVPAGDHAARPSVSGALNRSSRRRSPATSSTRAFAMNSAP